MDIERTLSVIVFTLLMATAIFLYRGQSTGGDPEEIVE